MFCRNRESGLVNSFMVFSILLHNQRIKEKISINLLVLNSWSIEKGTSGVCMGEGVRAHPSHPPSLQACLVVGKYTFFHGFAIQCGVLGGGGISLVVHDLFQKTGFKLHVHHTAHVANQMISQWCGATKMKDAHSSTSITSAWGWQRTQFHQENGFALVSIHLQKIVYHTLSGVLQYVIICLNSGLL